MKEIWKDAVGYKGYYQISNNGNLRSLDRITQYKKKYNRRVKGRPMILYTHRTGYFMCLMYGKNERVHRLVAEAFIPNPENKPCVNHKNSIRTDNRVENLEWVTYKENTAHAMAVGRVKLRGKDGPSVKLTEKEVLEIREICSKPDRPTFQRIGELFNTSRSNVHLIHYRKNWKVLP